MPNHFLIVHGAYGQPEGNWLPWLATQLRSYGKALTPRFPTPEGQNLEAWLAVADDALAGGAAQDTILIGHSVGAALIFRMAERTRQSFKAAFAVCPWTGDLGLPDFDLINASFVRPVFDWNAVRRGAEKIVCFAGDDDPYVPLACSGDVAKALDAELIVVKKGGHLNAEAGYREFPALLEKIHQSL